jgi:hypothetical protein
MGIEFRLGRNDHKVTEDYLASPSQVLDAITVDAHNVSRHASAIESALAHGVDVRVELLLDRLQNPGFDFGPLPYLDDGQLDPGVLAAEDRSLRRLADAAVDFQRGVGAGLVAPHLHSDGDPIDHVNVALAEWSVRRSGGDPVRAVIAANRDRLVTGDYQVARRLADQLASAGVSSVELRLSPTGDKDMSVRKVQTIFEIADVFTDVFEEVVLGCQGNLGPTALALGRATGFSTGIGLREQYNYTNLRVAQEPSEDEHAFGPQAGVYLPVADTTVPRRFAHGIYLDTAIRSRVRCPYACCRGRIDGPVQNPRAHFLRSRTEQLAAMLDRPLNWRPRMEQQRLESAIDTIEMINDGHVPRECHPIKVRTMRSLVQVIETAAAGGTAARAG